MKKHRSTKLPVTVIIPCHNAGKFLRDCVSSIEKSEPPDEIIIVDDFSTDDSYAVAQNLKDEFENVQVISTTRNVGPLHARSLGLRRAKNDFVAFVDADDFLEEHAIAEAYSIVSQTNGDICIWDMWRFDAGVVWPNIRLDSSSFPLSGREAVLATLNGWKIHPLGVAKKRLYSKAHETFTQSWINADELITRLVFAEAENVHFCSRKYFYRVNIESTTRRLGKHRLSSLYSYLWLIDFSRRFPEADPRAIARNGIAEAWFYYVNRKKIGSPAVITALSKFLCRLDEASKLGRWLWRHPKHFAAWFIMRTALRIAGQSRGRD